MGRDIQGMQAAGVRFFRSVIGIARRDKTKNGDIRNKPLVGSLNVTVKKYKRTGKTTYTA
jgi:hypothetical protein